MHASDGKEASVPTFRSLIDRFLKIGSVEPTAMEDSL